MVNPTVDGTWYIFGFELTHYYDHPVCYLPANRVLSNCPVLRAKAEEGPEGTLALMAASA